MIVGMNVSFPPDCYENLFTNLIQVKGKIQWLQKFIAQQGRYLFLYYTYIISLR